MSTKKIDMTARMQSLMTAANATTEDRFSRAEQIVERKPSGLASQPPITPDQPSARQPADADPANDVFYAPIAKIRDNPCNARKLYDPVKVSQRAASIRQDGQLTPALVCLDWENPGAYILVGGHYRKKALLQNGATVMQVKLVPAKSNQDLYRLSYIENDERENGTPMDDALAWQQMLDAGDYSNDDEISAVVNKPRASIVKTRALLKLPAPVLAILKESPDKFTLTAGYELTLMAEDFGIEELQKIAHQVAQGQLFTRELTRLREERRVGRVPRKQKEISRQHKILTDGAIVGTIKDWDSGKVVLEVRLADPIERQKLVEDLRERFGLTAEAAQLSLTK